MGLEGWRVGACHPTPWQGRSQEEEAWIEARRGEVRFEEFFTHINLMSDQVMGISECPYGFSSDSVDTAWMVSELMENDNNH